MSRAVVYAQISAGAVGTVGVTVTVAVAPAFRRFAPVGVKL